MQPVKREVGMFLTNYWKDMNQKLIFSTNYPKHKLIGSFYFSTFQLYFKLTSNSWELLRGK